MTALTVAMVVSALAGAGFAAMMNRAGRVMRASGGPGIIPFRLAESAQEADRYLRSWGEPGRQAARRSIRWDFPFIAAYVVLLASAALQLAARAGDIGYGWLAGVEQAAAVLTVVAGILDAVENGVLLSELSAHERRAGPGGAAAVTQRQVRVARWCAQVKFALLQAVATAVFVGFGVLELSGRPTSGRTTLVILLALPVAAAVFLAVARARPARPKPQPVPETTGLPAPP